MDPLADLLDGVRARAAAFCRSVLEAPWALRIADGAPLSLATTLRGQAWIIRDDQDPVLMETGDVVIVKGPAPYTVADDPTTLPRLILNAGNRVTTRQGADVTDDLRRQWRAGAPVPDSATVLASGSYQMSSDVTERLLKALPQVVLVPKTAARNPVMALLATEMGTEGAGQQVILDRLLDIALVSMLRAWFTHMDTAAPGWYRAQSDPFVSPAMRLMHENPAYPWTVADLATSVGCSRATLARRFATLVGEPPAGYLSSRRLTLAADLLRRSDLTVEAIAHQVGYASAFTLSVAFKRVRGVSPTSYRRSKP